MIAGGSSVGHPAPVAPRAMAQLERLLPIVRNQAAPMFVVDLEKISRNVAAIRHYFPRAELHYAVKANHDPRIIECLRADDCGFETASPGEVRWLLQLGVSPDKIIYGNPCFSAETLHWLLGQGISYFVVEHEEGLRRVCAASAGARIFLRLNLAAVEPHHVDYGATGRYLEHWGDSLRASAGRITGLCFYGLHARGLELAVDVIDHYLPDVRALNIGGCLGYPELEAELDREHVSGAFGSFRDMVNSVVGPRGMTLLMEPGSAIVRNAVHGFAHVVYRSTSGHNGTAIHVDLGPTLGLRKKPPGFYSPDRPVAVAPFARLVDSSCSKALIGVYRPCPLFDEGDIVLFPNVGAYSVVHMSDFHRLERPVFHYIERDGAAHADLREGPVAGVSAGAAR